jgi:hypothetical protein
MLFALSRVVKVVRLIGSALLIALVASAAWASFDAPEPGEVAVRDLPGTQRRWQEARTIVEAPPEVVRRWLTEYEFFTGRFHDVQQVEVLERNGNRVRMFLRSRIIGRPMIVDSEQVPEGIFYTAHDGGIGAAGRIFLTPVEGGRTDVIMQTTGHVGGVLGAFVPNGTMRSRERAKLTADLVDLNRLARARQSPEGTTPSAPSAPRSSARRPPPRTRR